MRRILAIDDSIITAPVIREVQTALAQVFVAHPDEIDAALAPWGITGLDIAAPQYERVVYEDELPPKREPSDAGSA